MPSSEPEHSAEALRRALPELLKLDRYERRAAARRERATREVADRKMLLDNHELWVAKNEANFLSSFPRLARSFLGEVDIA
jgi:hypothetical protein